MVRFSFMTQTAIVFLWRSTPMKFIAGLRVWVNGGLGKTPQVFPRIRGSANRRVDLHLPLIASIFGRRRRAWGGRTGARGTLRADHVSWAPASRDAERCVIASSTHPTGL